MRRICFSETFPCKEEMMNILKKSIESAWKADFCNDDIELWLNNFKGEFYHMDDERRLALWLLCNFTYYNINEIKYLCTLLFKKFVHRILIDDGATDSKELINLIRKCQFTCIGDASESGAMLLYYFRQETNLGIKKFFFPTALTLSDDANIVCIDDMMLSGNTAKCFYEEQLKNKPFKNIYYLALVASEEAIELLESCGIKVICCVVLDERCKVFSDKSLCFYKYPELKTVTKEIVEGYGKKIYSKHPLGYNDGEYVLGLYYNVPNNTLPIFWSKNNWHPLIPRKEKKQDGKYTKKFGLFI